MKDIKLYRNFFELMDERTELKLFKKYVFELIEIAETQKNEIAYLKQQLNNDSISVEERWERK